MNPTQQMQRLFREVNERIAEILAEEHESAAEFLCECGRPDCTNAIALDLSEYQTLRAQDGFFLVKPGHAFEGLDRVVESRDGYDLVVALEDRAE
jgi:hypothetical protein